MKKEHTRLSKVADKAKADADEVIGVGSEFIAIHNEFAAIVESKEMSKSVDKKLDALKVRSDRATKIQKKNLANLFDKEHATRFDCEDLGHEISRFEYQQGIR
ncbi:MAG: hypothetical protein JKY93_01840 [Gammaproteobacteria bacterium]|nr:hypothetical protein [Gammaproteobacteria bacterium]